jgi:hypothetical protein
MEERLRLIKHLKVGFRHRRGTSICDIDIERGIVSATLSRVVEKQLNVNCSITGVDGLTPELVHDVRETVSSMLARPRFG